MMTGNVTQAALDLSSLIRERGNADETSRTGFKQQRFIIGAFLIGCVMGGALSARMGLGIIILPGLAITICYIQEEYGRNVRPLAG
jgi:uncharacterized membrane protein YoaK (UPF0700 family)